MSAHSRRARYPGAYDAAVFTAAVLSKHNIALVHTTQL